MLALGLTGVLYFLELINKKTKIITKKLMKKTIAITLTIFSLLLVLDSFNFGHALMMFYLAGVVPGTNIAIDANRMLGFFAVIAGFTVGRIMSYIVRSSKPTISSISRATLSTN
jgi:hypothetical protein